MSPSNTQTKRLSGTAYCEWHGATEVSLISCLQLRSRFSIVHSSSETSLTFKKTHSTLRFHFAPLTYSSLEWTGSSNAKSQYCSTNHIRWPKLVLGSWQIKKFPLAFFLRQGGEDGSGWAVHIPLWNSTLEMSRVSSCSNALSLHEHHASLHL